MNKSTHDLIIEELQKYFIENQTWELKQSKGAAKRVRNHLSKIHKLTSIRRKEIQSVVHAKTKGPPRGNNIVKYNSDLKKGNQDNT